jgi:hypothetical protein
MKKALGLSLSLVVVIAGVLVVGKVAPVRAKSGCTNASLQGSYGIHATGTFTAGPNAGPAAFVGVLTFDGLGQLTLSLTQRLSSATGPITLTKVPFVGTYSVSADCTVEDVWHNMLNGTSSTHESIIIDNGRGFFILNTSTGAPNVVSGVGRKQFAGEHDDRN